MDSDSIHRFPTAPRLPTVLTCSACDAEFPRLYVVDGRCLDCRILDQSETSLQAWGTSPSALAIEHIIVYGHPRRRLRKRRPPRSSPRRWWAQIIADKHPKEVRLTISGLTRPQQLVYQAYFLEQLDRFEVAKRLHRSPEAVAKIVARIRQHFTDSGLPEPRHHRDAAQT